MEAYIDGTTQTGYIAGSFVPIVLDGNHLNASGLTFGEGSSGSTVRGLVVRDFEENGIIYSTTIDLTQTFDDVIITSSIGYVTHELIVIDTSLPDYQQLVSAWGLYTSNDRSMDVLFVDRTVDGVEAVTEYLSRSGTQYDAIHLATHGFAGIHARHTCPIVY
jgi:hypothetical protein